MVRAGWGMLFVTRISPALSYRFAAVGLLVLALGLSACGRKGPLDAPPGGLAADANGTLDDETDQGGDEIASKRRKSKSLPIIRGPNRPIPLDVLID
jgi:predicted small lipoprotein YifL